MSSAAQSYEILKGHYKEVMNGLVVLNDQHKENGLDKKTGRGSAG